jgi:DNA repair exonuclease SbcCD ATPase subunit
MRPISLEMEGFTSFRQRVTIDFTKFDLFAITGPTGAGKTSIIDAMIYALYGCTPRIGNKSIKDLISQGGDRFGAERAARPMPGLTRRMERSGSRALIEWERRRRLLRRLLVWISIASRNLWCCRRDSSMNSLKGRLTIAGRSFLNFCSLIFMAA